MAAVPILSGDEWDSSTSVEGHRAADGEDMQAFMNALSPGYFETMKIPILEGRDFRQSDLMQQPTVAIVNRRFAEHFFKGKSAVGKRLGRGTGPNTKLTIEIIGVVADSLYEGPREGVRRQVFVPNWGRNSAAFYVRAHTGSASAFNLIRNEVKQLDSAMPVYEMKTVEGQLDETLLTDRLIALLSAGFGLLATAAGLDRPLRRDGVRRGAAQEGTGDPAGARRAAGARHLDGHARGAAAALDRPGRRHSGRDGARDASCRRSSTASSRAIPGWPVRRWCC